MLFILVLLVIFAGPSLGTVLKQEGNSFCPNKTLMTGPCFDLCTDDRNCTTMGYICCEGACKKNKTASYKQCVKRDVCPEYCKNGGICIRTGMTTARCECINGYKGDRCDEERNLCADLNPCGEFGTCKKKLNDYDCCCLDGFYGKNCTQSKDRCQKVAEDKCVNHPDAISLTIPRFYLLDHTKRKLIDVTNFCGIPPTGVSNLQPTTKSAKFDLLDVIGEN